jgi:hypothetical protein
MPKPHQLGDLRCWEQEKLDQLGREKRLREAYRAELATLIDESKPKEGTDA